MICPVLHLDKDRGFQPFSSIRVSDDPGSGSADIFVGSCMVQMPMRIEHNLHWASLALLGYEL